MLKTIITAALLLTTVAPAFAADTESFTRDGQTFVYTRTTKNNQVVLHGRNTTSGATFQLVVVGDRVSGVSDGLPVSFVMPASKTVPTQVAAR